VVLIVVLELHVLSTGFFSERFFVPFFWSFSEEAKIQGNQKKTVKIWCMIDCLN